MRFVYLMLIDLKLFMSMRIYVNILMPRHRQERLHSSFVVFYFVFVL